MSALSGGRPPIALVLDDMAGPSAHMLFTSDDDPWRAVEPCRRAVITARLHGTGGFATARPIAQLSILPFLGPCRGR